MGSVLLSCARCGGYTGQTADPSAAGKPVLCAACAQLVANWPYPQWLKLALACLLLLLAFALVHGRKYFHAGRTMYRGERLVEKKQYAEALPYLQETLRLAPRSDKAALLAAKAALLTGDVDSADKALHGHDGGYFEHTDEPRFREVEALWNRATAALKKAEQATRLEEQDGKEVEAARLMHEAASEYPELSGLALAAEAYDSGAAFARKDYDTFVAIAEKEWKEHPMPNTAAALASALACKYAVTGNALLRQRAGEMLRKAGELAQRNAEAIKMLEEYSPRIQYRIESRQVITKNEYDRRFRGGKTPAKQ